MHAAIEPFLMPNTLPLPTIVANDKEHLQSLIRDCMAVGGDRCDLNHIDVSQITDMANLFHKSTFDGDISRWDVSNVTNMRVMFGYSRFQGDLSRWNVANVTDMDGMFWDSVFNGDISRWDVSNVTTMRTMFYKSKFTGDVSSWCVGRVKDMSGMFEESSFCGDVSEWDVTSVEDMSEMFFDSPFRGDLSRWSLHRVKNIETTMRLAALAECPAPSQYHWLMALKFPDVLDARSEWSTHFQAIAPVVQGLGLEGMEAARTMHASWMQRAMAPHIHETSIPLPQLD